MDTEAYPFGGLLEVCWSSWRFNTQLKLPYDVPISEVREWFLGQVLGNPVPLSEGVEKELSRKTKIYEQLKDGKEVWSSGNLGNQEYQECTYSIVSQVPSRMSPTTFERPDHLFRYLLVNSRTRMSWEDRRSFVLLQKAQISTTRELSFGKSLGLFHTYSTCFQLLLYLPEAQTQI